MVEKAARQGIRFRPHFKTHQSAAVGEWFRQMGVDGITVSSVEMAQYFARNGWRDITIAFSVNWREKHALQVLAEQVHLGLLVESVETAEFLSREITHPVDIWVKVDEGTHRTGIQWDDMDNFFRVVDTLVHVRHLKLRGLLTHSGRTYRAATPDAACQDYQEGVRRLNEVRDRLFERYGLKLEVSMGDTPGCTLCEDLGRVDEIRPGNFVFYDAQQYQAGVCSFEQVAAVVACPVVAKHADRNEVVIFGGAIHLTKDLVATEEGPAYGLVCFPTKDGWSDPIQGGRVVRLSQEHGIISLPGPAFDQGCVGDLLMVVPAHVCLTVSAMRRYRLLDGEWIETLNQ
jgi:D-serine deaminase-like pyridoxal phosphate-dependent protein